MLALALLAALVLASPAAAPTTAPTSAPGIEIVLPSPTPSPAPGTAPTPAGLPVDAAGDLLTPSKIFENARLAMYLRTYPRYLSYVIDIQSIAYGKHYHEGYRAFLRTYDGALAVKQTPIYTTNQTSDAYGFSFFGLYRTGKPENHIEPPFGVPLMSATYDFGLAQAPLSRANLGPREAAIEAIMGTPPPVLGHVTVTGGDYDISLVGTESLEGQPVYHLAMHPRSNPSAHRLRELWVDTRSFVVRKLVTQGIFAGGPPAQANWTVGFVELHGYWLIRTETTAATMRAFGHLFGHATVYHGVSYTFGDYAYPGLISDLEFDAPQAGSDAMQF